MDIRQFPINSYPRFLKINRWLCLGYKTIYLFTKGEKSWKEIFQK
jgi:hypothetical protein